jgi:hypothetical protein
MAMTFQELEFGVLFEFAYGGGWVIGEKVAENKARLYESGAEIFLARKSKYSPRMSGINES